MRNRKGFTLSQNRSSQCDNNIGLDITCVQREDQFYSLISEWNRLAEATGLNSVFLRHEWFDAAWQWVKQECELCILCMSSRGDLVGICPLIRRRFTQRSLGVRAIEFLAVPDTQLCDILVAPAHHRYVVEAMVAYLDRTRREWDILKLDKLPPASRTAELLRTRLEGERFGTFIESARSNLYVRLDESWEAFYWRRSRRLKKGNNLVANRLKRRHENIDIRWFRGPNTDAKAVEDALEVAILISSRSWKKETGLSLDHKGPGAFIRALTHHAHDQGVAAEYQLIYKRKVHALRADFDHAYEELSPGTYLNWKLLEQLFDDDVAYYYMGPGGRPYKKRWAEGSESLDRLFGFSKTFRGRTLSIMERQVLPVARRILRR
jgi:CelD/BcsL family acetyltransferase involved in cellulose biosynthesis